MKGKEFWKEMHDLMDYGGLRLKGGCKSGYLITPWIDSQTGKEAKETPIPEVYTKAFEEG